jgi:hypothetical protein
MGDFDLDLRAVEEQLDEEDGRRVVLGILDGSTPPAEWTALVTDGHVLLLAVEGDVNELAADFAEDVRDDGGDLIHFRETLVVTPPDVDIDADRL